MKTRVHKLKTALQTYYKVKTRLLYFWDYSNYILYIIHILFNKIFKWFM